MGLKCKLTDFAIFIHAVLIATMVRVCCSHEGRTWYSSHRGPLWIASAAHEPEEAEIKELEEHALTKGYHMLKLLFVLHGIWVL